MSRPVLLDLFCGQGGAAKGYHDAGFDVVGVDNQPQPRYPYEFHQADANTFPLDGFDALHASPPCQDHSVSRGPHQSHGTYWMLAHTLQRFQAAELPYVVENVGAARLPSAVTLCGTVFGLGLHRHRRFETSWMTLSPGCDRSRIQYRGRSAEVFGHHGNSDRIRTEWGVEWMTQQGIAQCIPPAFTRYLGEQLLQEVRSVRAYPRA